MNLDYNIYLEECKQRNICPLTHLGFLQSQGMHMVAQALEIVDVGAWIAELTQDHQRTHADLRRECEEPRSRGLGDTVAKITHATGLDKLAQMYTDITGKDCGCKSRQEALNRLMPYVPYEVKKEQ